MTNHIEKLYNRVANSMSIWDSIREVFPDRKYMPLNILLEDIANLDTLIYIKNLIRYENLSGFELFLDEKHKAIILKIIEIDGFTLARNKLDGDGFHFMYEKEEVYYERMISELEKNIK